MSHPVARAESECRQKIRNGARRGKIGAHCAQWRAKRTQRAVIIATTYHRRERSSAENRAVADREVKRYLPR